MWAWAVLTGRSLTDLLTATVCAVIVGFTGLVVGWTAPSDVGSLLAGFAVALLFAYALSWLGVCVGLLARSAESAQAFGFMVLFPLTFISNALGAHRRDARAPAHVRRLEPGERGDGCGPLSVGRPEPVTGQLVLVDAAPGHHGARAGRSRSWPCACRSRRCCSDAAPRTEGVGAVLGRPNAAPISRQAWAAGSCRWPNAAAQRRTSPPRHSTAPDVAPGAVTHHPAHGRPPGAGRITQRID